jgi:hypothetical protein
MYGRIGTQADVDAKISDAVKTAEQTGNDFIEIIITAETVVITVEGKTAMRAIKRAPDMWMCLYNPEYYPKPGI